MHNRTHPVNPEQVREGLLRVEAAMTILRHTADEAAAVGLDRAEAALAVLQSVVEMIEQPWGRV